MFFFLQGSVVQGCSAGVTLVFIRILGYSTIVPRCFVVPPMFRIPFFLGVCCSTGVPCSDVPCSSIPGFIVCWLWKWTQNFYWPRHFGWKQFTRRLSCQPNQNKILGKRNRPSTRHLLPDFVNVLQWLAIFLSSNTALGSLIVCGPSPVNNDCLPSSSVSRRCVRSSPSKGNPLNSQLNLRHIQNSSAICKR